MNSQPHDTPPRAVSANERAETDFWRDIEARFLALHDEQLQHRGMDAVHALWSSKGFGRADGSPWSVSGGTEVILRKFEWLVESAEARLGDSRGPNAISSWLDRLKAESPHFQPLQSSFKEKGKRWRHWKSGRIEFVCKASAEYCVKCETQEVTGARQLVAPPFQHEQAPKAEVGIRRGGQRPERVKIMVKNGGKVTSRKPTRAETRDIYEKLLPEVEQAIALIRGRDGEISVRKLEKSFDQKILGRWTDRKDIETMIDEYGKSKGRVASAKNMTRAIIRHRTGQPDQTIKTYIKGLSKA